MSKKISHKEILEKVLTELRTDKTRALGIKDFIRPNEHPTINKMLQLHFDNRYSSSISEYLDFVNAKEMDFFRIFTEAIPLTDSMNPHIRPYKLREYYVDKVENKQLRHLQLLNELLKENKRSLAKIKTVRGILQIGEVGSGKTFSQNVWLHDNYHQLENLGIFWVRLDASKLIRLWDDSEDLKNKNLTSIEEYFIGQLLYVFCKHCIDIFPMASSLFTEIFKKLEQHPSNEIPSSVYSFQSQADVSLSDYDIFTFYANKKKIKRISDYLREIERQISVYEGYYTGEKTRLEANKRFHTDKSFLIDRVLLESQRFTTDRYKGNKRDWMVIGNILKTFVLSQGYRLLYIIDGVENINFLFHNKRNYIDKILKGLYDFPLNLHNSHPNEIVLLSLRDTTYESLKRIANENKYTDFNKYKDIDTFFKIYQDTNLLPKLALDKRIVYVLKILKRKSCFMAEVMKTLLRYHNIPDETRWNANLRCFLNNHITLAKLITFRFYFANQPIDFNIEDQINIFEEINFLLNGNLYVDEQIRGSVYDRGHSLFNLFGYVEKKTNHPSYFIYSRILQLVWKKPNINEDKLKNVTKLFNYSDDDIEFALDDLIYNGLIKLSYTPNVRDKVKLNITSKGEYALFIFYNNIHYLYYSCLNTLVPNDIIKVINVSPNNFPVGSNDKRFYPPNSIRTSAVFLKYLIEQNNTDLKILAYNKTSIDINTFKLPIKENILTISLLNMVKRCFQDEDYETALISFLENFSDER